MVHSAMGRMGILITMLLVHCSGVEVEYVNMTCGSTGWLNDWDGTQDWLHMDDIFLSGQESKHEDWQEDRQYKWHYCRVENGNDPFTGEEQSINGTDYDADWLRGCGGKSALVDVYSVHSNGKEDRSFEFKCKDINSDYRLEQCALTGWLNDWDDILNFTCPDNGVIRTMESGHANRQEDRRWKFECCRLVVNDYEYHQMKQTEDSHWVNDWDESFKVQNDYKFLTGVYAEHANRQEDRRFKWRYVEPADDTSLLTFPIGKTSTDWTSYGADVSFECGSNEAIIGIESQHSNGEEDRQWKFTCGQLQAPLFGLADSDCGWTGYLNNYDGLLDFQCPNDGVIKGIWSTFSGGPKNDRIFKFHCCQVAKYTLTEPKGQWQLVNRCTGCGIYTHTISRGVSLSGTEQLTESYSNSLSNKFGIGYEFTYTREVDWWSESTHKVNVNYELSHTSSSSKTSMMKQTYTTTMTTVDTNSCDKTHFYQWQESVVNIVPGYPDETVDIYSNSYFYCTDGQAPQCPPDFCTEGGKNCTICTDEWNMYYGESATPLVDKGNDPTETLDECEGDCDYDDDCNGDLLCWQRENSEPVPPGCSGTAHSPNHDYCWDSTLAKPLVNKGDDPSDLGQCEGNCDYDTDCRGGMKCYQREDCGTGCIPPGCTGTPYSSDHDYCYGGEAGIVSARSPGMMMADPFDVDDYDDPNAEDPVNESWSTWYLIHYYDLMAVLIAALVVLCAVNLCVTVRQKQQAVPYVVVKQFDTESERDVEAMPMVQ